MFVTIALMQSSEIRKRFLEFFQKRGHTIIPSASLITSDEKGLTNATLFNTAGMQPLIPYLLGKPYFVGGHDKEKGGQEIKRLANSQKCLRTVDIDDVGDKTHVTFFEMLGNWSLGDYFKKEAIDWSYEFLTNPQDGSEGDRGLGLDPSRLYVTVFEGDDIAPRDDEAANIWREIFNQVSKEKEGGGVSPGALLKSVKKVDTFSDSGGGQSGALRSRIFYMPAANNWWEAGENGPCGPDSEMFYDISNKFGGRALTKEEFLAADEARDVVEVWNDVFMQYEKKDGKIVGKLPKPSVDTGAGLERLTMTVQGADNVYDTDLFKEVMEEIKKSSKNWNQGSARIIADHVRAAIFLIADGVVPSNTDRGYILRKILRRAVRKQKEIAFNVPNLSEIVPGFITIYKNTSYHETLKTSELHIKQIFAQEGRKFIEVLHGGDIEIGNLIKKALTENRSISGKEAFVLYSSYGFPIEETVKIAKIDGIEVDIVGFNAEFKKHQELSRTGAEQKFKGGLADANNPKVVKYHTATHLLHQALHDVLGDHVAQKGSNITTERLRFDFSHTAKMTDEEKKKVEDIVNQKIKEALPVSQILMSREEAEKTGARHLFGEKYGDHISIYFVGKASNPPVLADLVTAYSKEFCGGPHVKNTSELGHFKIQKEEAVAQGVRRIKAVLE